MRCCMRSLAPRASRSASSSASTNSTPSLGLHANLSGPWRGLEDASSVTSAASSFSAASAISASMFIFHWSGSRTLRRSYERVSSSVKVGAWSGVGSAAARPSRVRAPAPAPDSRSALRARLRVSRRSRWRSAACSCGGRIGSARGICPMPRGSSVMSPRLPDPVVDVVPMDADAWCEPAPTVAPWPLCLLTRALPRAASPREVRCRCPSSPPRPSAVPATSINPSEAAPMDASSRYGFLDPRPEDEASPSERIGAARSSRTRVAVSRSSGKVSPAVVITPRRRGVWRGARPRRSFRSFQRRHREVTAKNV